MNSAKKGIDTGRVVRVFIFILFLLVNFFIYIGETTKFVLFLPFRTIRFLYIRYVLSFINFVIRASQKIHSQIQKLVSSIKFPVIPKSKKKKKKIKIEKRYSLSSYLSRTRKSIIKRFQGIGQKISSIKLKFLKIKIPKLPKFLTFQYTKKYTQSKVKKEKSRKTKKRKKLSLLAIKVRYFFIGIVIASTVFSFYQGYAFVRALPSPESIGKINYSLTSHILDRNDRVLYEIYHDQNRTPVKLKNLPSYVTDATIAIEDKDFFNHKGVSVFGGIARALKDTVSTGDLQGGSTITQQLVKTALLTPERTIDRKIKEIILALWAERLYSKQQILEMYFNQVPYGGSAYGIEEAAMRYFGKHASQLTLSEAAFLAGLPQAPSRYSPYTNPKLSEQRRNDVLNAMYVQGKINLSTYNKAKSKKIAVKSPDTTIQAPHFVFYARDELAKLYGVRQVEEGGLRVKTSLDLDIQKQAERILKEELDKVKNLNVTNGAILVTHPATGEILAMVGSRDYFELPDGAFNVTTALRQPGSSIKPLMYSLALTRGYTAATPIVDAPITFAISQSESYRPVNYDGRFHGVIPLRAALANSYNIPAVKTLNTIGVQNFVDQAKRMGITTWDKSSGYGLSITLGGADVKMIDMATAFGVFANGGYRVDVTPFLSVENGQGRVIRQLSPAKTRVLGEDVTYILSDILSDNQARIPAFGNRSALEIPGHKVAVKTGTTDEKKDNWTIGYTPEFLVAVWVGNNDNTPMNRQLASGITGAAPIWSRVMTYLLTEYGGDNKWFNKPANVIEKKCYGGKSEYFVAGTESKASCGQPLVPRVSPTPLPH